MIPYFIPAPDMDDDNDSEMTLGGIIGTFLGVVIGLGASMFCVQMFGDWAQDWCWHTLRRNLPDYIEFPLLILVAVLPFVVCTFGGGFIGLILSPSRWVYRKDKKRKKRI